MICKVIEEIRPGLMVTTVSSGADALDKVTNNNYAAILTDLNMPGMDGFEFAEKALAIKPDTPLALLTATASEAVISRANDMNIGCLAKPPEKATLNDFLTQADL